jgi:hypothetical protein
VALEGELFGSYRELCGSPLQLGGDLKDEVHPASQKVAHS